MDFNSFCNLAIVPLPPSNNVSEFFINSTKTFIKKILCCQKLLNVHTNHISPSNYRNIYIVKFVYKNDELFRRELIRQESKRKIAEKKQSSRPCFCSVCQKNNCILFSLFISCWRKFSTFWAVSSRQSCSVNELCL